VKLPDSPHRTPVVEAAPELVVVAVALMLVELVMLEVAVAVLFA